MKTMQLMHNMRSEINVNQNLKHSVNSWIIRLILSFLGTGDYRLPIENSCGLPARHIVQFDRISLPAILRILCLEAAFGVMSSYGSSCHHLQTSFLHSRLMD